MPKSDHVSVRAARPLLPDMTACRKSKLPPGAWLKTPALLSSVTGLSVGRGPASAGAGPGRGPRPKTSMEASGSSMAGCERGPELRKAVAVEAAEGEDAPLEAAVPYSIPTGIVQRIIEHETGTGRSPSSLTDRGPTNDSQALAYWLLIFHVCSLQCIRLRSTDKIIQAGRVCTRNTCMCCKVMTLGLPEAAPCVLLPDPESWQAAVEAQSAGLPCCWKPAWSCGPPIAGQHCMNQAGHMRSTGRMQVIAGRKALCSCAGHAIEKRAHARLIGGVQLAAYAGQL